MWTWVPILCASNADLQVDPEHPGSMTHPISFGTAVGEEWLATLLRLEEPSISEFVIITYFLTLNFFSTIKQCTFKVSCFVPMQTLSLNNSIT